MATLEEIYAKIVSDDTEKKALAEAFATEEGAAAFLAQRGCEASPVEFVAFMREKAGATGELADKTLEGAAAGFGVYDFSVSFCTLGVGCGIIAAVSYASDKGAVADPTFDLCDKI